MSLNSVFFAADGYWTCPDGITTILIIGAGGGGGGGAARCRYGVGGGGGGGSLQQTSWASVTPGETYNIFVGLGGAGGVYIEDDDSTFCGLDGYATYMIDGYNNNIFYALGGGGAGTNVNGGFNHGGVPWAYGLGQSTLEAQTVPGVGTTHCSPNFPGSGGGTEGSGNALSGMMNLLGGYSPGLANFDIGSYNASGGGAGPRGPGGNAGTLASPNGSDAMPNTGAGGGGGNTMCDNGGIGGSGYLTIIW